MERIHMPTNEPLSAGGTIPKGENVPKSLPGAKSPDGFSFDLRRGERHALVGGNGFFCSNLKGQR
jgi:ABC-type sugar transport system ATPase subunit